MNIHGVYMLYNIIVTLKDGSVQTFQHEAGDAVDAIRHFNENESVEAVQARAELERIEAYPAE
jgi:hypothetical protein